MVPPFKLYFFPFLNELNKRGCCRLSDLGIYVAIFFRLSDCDLNEKIPSKRITKHKSRINYCASYLKRMNLVESLSYGAYQITERGKYILSKFGPNLTLTDLRNLPEFISTQVSSHSDNIVYIKSHVRNGKKVSAYICNKKFIRESNPNIDNEKLKYFDCSFNKNVQ